MQTLVKIKTNPILLNIKYYFNLAKIPIQKPIKNTTYAVFLN
jgi:hypothetical protein